MKLATTTGDFSWYVSDQAETIAYIANAGFRYLDYNFERDYRERTGVYCEGARTYGERLRRQADKFGVQFVQAHAPMGAPIAEDNQNFIQDTIRCVELCHELSIPNLVVHSGYLPNLTMEETFEKNKAFFRKILQVAENYGINILVENFDKMCIDCIYWIDNAPDLLKLIEYVDHPLFHAVWDAGHGNMQPMPQHESLNILGKHIYALHIQDNMGEKDEHRPPFFGTLSLDSLMHGLKKIGYNGYFTFETGIFTSELIRKEFTQDERLKKAPLELKIKAESLLYEIGKYILISYDCFEE